MARDKVVDTVDAIIKDMTGRGGGDEWWDGIDAVTRREIKQAWRAIVRAGADGKLKKGRYSYSIVEAK